MDGIRKFSCCAFVVTHCLPLLLAQLLQLTEVTAYWKGNPKGARRTCVLLASRPRDDRRATKRPEDILPQPTHLLLCQLHSEHWAFGDHPLLRPRLAYASATASVAENVDLSPDASAAATVNQEALQAELEGFAGLLTVDATFNLLELSEIAFGSGSQPTAHLAFEGARSPAGEAESSAKQAIRLLFFCDKAREDWRQSLSPCLHGFIPASETELPEEKEESDNKVADQD